MLYIWVEINGATTYILCLQNVLLSTVIYVPHRYNRVLYQIIFYLTFGCHCIILKQRSKRDGYLDDKICVRW
jgi:hypothetical protein